MKRVILIIMDSFGIGASADADQFGGEGYNDVGSNTFGHIAQAFARGEADSSERSGPIQFPHLNQLGLGRREKGRRREKGQEGAKRVRREKGQCSYFIFMLSPNTSSPIPVNFLRLFLVE